MIKFIELELEDNIKMLFNINNIIGVQKSWNENHTLLHAVPYCSSNDNGDYFLINDTYDNVKNKIINKINE